MCKISPREDDFPGALCYLAGMRKFLLVACLLLILASCSPSTTAVTPTTTVAAATASLTATPSHTATRYATNTPYAGTPLNIGDGWQTGSAVEAGIDPLWLTRMLAAIYRGPESGDSLTLPGGAPKFENIHSVLIVRGGKLVFEEYFNNYHRANTHDTYSATKSITSLLTGLAIERGYLSGVDELVLPWFPDYTPPELSGFWAAITVEDLLTMRSGLDCNDWSPDSPAYYLKSFEWRGPDALADIFSLQALVTPGKVFSYCSPGVDLLGTLLERAIGQTLTQFARVHLFYQLGFPGRSFQELPGGCPDASGHVYLTPREMARLGQLMLQGGNWDGKQIIPQEWFQTSTSMHMPLDFNLTWGSGYGYLWWLNEVSLHGWRIDSFSASGYGGQVITIFPSLDMVVVFTGGNFENDEGQPFQIMERYILPAVAP